MFGRGRKRKARDVQMRAEGLMIASQMLRMLGNSTENTERADLRRGMLCAAGIASVMSAAALNGGEEQAFIDIGDGEMLPVHLNLNVVGRS
jgi:hypothetical protein